jgi:outer membrane receptor protein involved in Fe transport
MKKWLTVALSTLVFADLLLAEEVADQASTAKPEIVSEESSVSKPQSKTRRVISEVLVTAQKREQSIQDVPISMSALDQEFIIEQGITDVSEAMLLVPNVQIEEAGFFMAPRVRGFSFDNNNKAFEPPVGIVLDGVPYTRVPYFMAALFDIQRIEVLRGPQGTAFGKNTTAGLIHLITNKPSSEPNSALTVQSGELNRKRIEASYGGPLSDGINIRIAGMLDERDGFIKNTTGLTNDFVPDKLRDRRRSGIRTRIQFEDVLGGELITSLENVRLVSGGAAFEYRRTSAGFRDVARTYDPNFDAIPGNWTASEDTRGIRDVRINTLHYDWSGDWGDWGVSTVGATSVMEQTLALDVDFTPAPATLGYGGDRSPTTSIEFKFTAPLMDGILGLGNIGSSDLLFGVIAEQRDILDSFFRFGINDGPLLELVVAAGNDNSVGVDTALAAGAAVNAYEELNQRFNQHSTALAVYGHWQWHFSQNWGMEVGARVTDEKKDANWDLVFNTNEDGVIRALGFQEFTAALDRHETNLQPKIAFSYKPTDNFSLFAHWARGYKGGGYNAFAYRGENEDGNDDELDYDPEITTEWSLNLKTTLLDGAAKFNLSLFHMLADDFQVLVRINPAGTIGLGVTAVENAAAARAQGLEADFTWLPTDWLTLITTLGHNDTEYLNFTNNTCPSDRPNTDGDDDNRCDATGRSFPYAPEWTGTVTGSLNFDIGNGFEVYAGSTIEYQTVQFIDVDLDPRKTSPAFHRVKLNVGLGKPENNWSVRLIGENVNNAKVWVREGDIFSGQFAAIQTAPRLFYLQFRQDFD